MKASHALLAGAVTVLCVLNGALAAHATEGPVDDPGKVAEHESTLVSTDVVGSTVRLQDDLSRGSLTTDPDATVKPIIHRTVSISDVGSKVIRPSGGVRGTITTGFASSVTCPGNCSRYEIEGKSYGKWLGTTPYNATSISLRDKYWVAGIATTVSIPWGAGFSAGGESATWSGSVSKAWRITHQYSGVHFSGLPLFSYSQKSTATFKFGTGFFTTDSDYAA
jgi:hypothetical protein